MLNRLAKDSSANLRKRPRATVFIHEQREVVSGTMAAPGGNGVHKVRFFSRRQGRIAEHEQ